MLLVGDETALPAVAGICASLPPDATGTALVEVPSLQDVQDFPRPDGVALRWIVRDTPAKPGSLALAALRDLPDADVDAERVHAWIAGEQALATDGRRHLVDERGVAKDRVSFTGYWKCG